MKRSFASKRSDAAVSLLEILITVGILGILCGLTLPVVNQLGRKQDSLTCLSNLRQIGQGIQSFAFDHNGDLPGPLYVAQYPYQKSANQLAYQLTNYLIIDTTSTKYKYRDAFVCPAFRKSVKKLGSIPVYSLNITVPMVGQESLQHPFGYPNADYKKLYGIDTNFPVMKIQQLASVADTNGLAASSRTWMLKDIDQEDPWLRSLPLDAFSNFPKKKVHRSHRNALFFDFHVETVDQDTAN